MREIPHAGDRARERGTVLASLRPGDDAGSRERLREEVLAQPLQRVRPQGRVVAELRAHRGRKGRPGQRGKVFVLRVDVQELLAQLPQIEGMPLLRKIEGLVERFVRILLKEWIVAVEMLIDREEI